ncbi:MAG: ROK family transcriptional regulator [Spirochaetales bacterium]|nr:ROK family transcriptional regulator [Spirochaetales bacterium]
MKTGDKDYIKRLNLGIVLDVIREEGPISRAGISRRTSLSRSTCSLLSDELIQSGLVKEQGKDESSGGRKGVLLELNYERGRAVGLKVMADAIHGALVDLKGNMVRRESLPVEPGKDGPGEYIRKLIMLVESLLQFENSGQKPREILGIGIGLSGRVDSERGILLESAILGWENVDLVTPVKERFHVPVYIENDVNTFTIGEKYFGDGRQYQDYICLTVGRGIGLGIVLDNGLYRGAHHGAGELGHMKLETSGTAPLCTCGKKGCLEVFASDPAIIEMVRESSGKELSIEEIRDMAGKGDESCLEAYRRAGRYLGIGLSNVINFFDPQAVIIGGEGSTASPYFLPEMRKAVLENTVYGLSSNLSIEPVLFEDDLWVRGVATLVVREVFRIAL